MPASSSGSEPTPPSPPSSAASAPRPPRTAFPLALAAAAALSCWNLFGAPFAIVVAAGALALSVRRTALSSGAARWRLRGAAAISGVALLVAAFVLVNAFRGVAPGAAVPGAPTTATKDAGGALDEAERRTAERREAARRELERVGPGSEPATPPDSRRAR